MRRRGWDAVAAALICLGALALVTGTLLPLDHSRNLFGQIRQDTLIEHGGWVLALIATFAALAGHRSYRTRTPTWTPLLLGVTGLGVVLWMSSDSALRTTYELGLGGFGIPAQMIVLPLGSGPYVAGAGAAVVLLGGWMLRRTSRVLASGGGSSPAPSAGSPA